MSEEYSGAVVADLHAMARAAAPCWGLSADCTATLMCLSENATFRLDDPVTGAVLSVRFHRQGYHQDQEILSELAWIMALGQDGAVQIPTPRRGIDGQILQYIPSVAGFGGRRVVAFEFIDGQTPDPAEDDLTPWFATLGEITAQMHNQAQGWQQPAGFIRKRWDVEAMVGAVSYWGPWQAALGLSPANWPLIEAAITKARRMLAEYGESSDRFGLIHADLRLSNLLVTANGLRVIDFDDCGLSWFFYDFAAAISFYEHHPAVPDWQAAWLAGYQRQRCIRSCDVKVLPALVILRRILLTAWLASHHEIPLAQQLGAGYTAGTLALAEQFLATAP